MVNLNFCTPGERTFWYCRMAKYLEGQDVVINWISPYEYHKHLGSEKIAGFVRWHGKLWKVEIARGLPIAEEVKVFAHEIAHILLGHISKGQGTSGEVNATLADAASAIESKDVFYRTREAEADAKAEELLKKWKKSGLTY